MKFLPLIALLLVALLAGIVPAEEKPAAEPVNATPEWLKLRVEIEGRIGCVGCAIRAFEPRADPQCTLHAKHAQGLVGTDGTIYSFLDNARGHLLITDPKWKGREVKVLAWKYAKAQVIEVSRFQAKDGDKWVAYDYCRSCGFEPGDNRDTGLCADCRDE